MSQKVSIDPADYLAWIHPYFTGAQCLDSSCSPQARVIYIERDGGYFLKIALEGTLAKEAMLTEYFQGLDLAAKVLNYGSEGGLDYLVTEKVRGDD